MQKSAASPARQAEQLRDRMAKIDQARNAEMQDRLDATQRLVDTALATLAARIDPTNLALIQRGKAAEEIQ